MSQQAQRGTFNAHNASTVKMGIVCAQFNLDIVQGLLVSALEECEKYSISKENIFIQKVPGSVEIPVVAKAFIDSKKVDCVVVLGVIIQGDTKHFDYVANVVTDGVRELMVQTGVPIGFGILTCNTHEQAVSRISHGSAAVIAALHALKSIREIESL
ncbi:MAG: 6,7-dimethyl-8-ribityllumazine synthase [Patescibacteria group bacterium]